VSVNGHYVGTVRVESAHTDVQWTVRLDEPVAFAELHSEQGVRMGLLHVDLPPEGSVVQRVSVALADQRRIDLSMDFSELHPTIAVEYVDPTLLAAVVRLADGERVAAMARQTTAADATVPGRRSWKSCLRTAWLSPRWLVPVVGFVGLILAATTWWNGGRRDITPEPPVLLEQAVASEASSLRPSGDAVHRTLQFQMRRADTGTLAFTHRIESWTHGTSEAVRVFDSTGHLVAGLWNRDGSKRVLELGLADEIWQAPLSAAAFRDRYGSLGRCRTASNAATYTLTCERASASSRWLERVYPALHAQEPGSPPPAVQRGGMERGTHVVTRAALVLRRSDLHTTQLAVALRIADVEQIITIEEQAVEHVPPAQIPGDIFVPETPQPAAARSSTSGTARQSPPVPTLSLELRLVELVDRLVTNEDVSVRRDSTQQLSVTGLVSTETRKRAVLAAVADLDATGIISTQVQTFEDAAQRARHVSRPRKGGQSPLRLLEAPARAAPIAEHVRGRVSPDVDVDAVVRELTPQVLAWSERVKRHAMVLRTFLDRFDDSIAQLDPDARLSRLAFVRRHAAACLEALESLERALSPYFDKDDGAWVHPPDTVRAAGHQLANEAATIEEAIAAAFTISDAQDVGTWSRALDIRQHISRARSDARALDGLTRE
jgi:hypothetical protein